VLFHLRSRTSRSAPSTRALRRPAARALEIRFEKLTGRTPRHEMLRVQLDRVKQRPIRPFGRAGRTRRYGA
jgi:hypothetical protein